MLESASPLKSRYLNSRLQSQSRLKPSGGRMRRLTVASLMLTSLVDAFSILVIFLIMNHSADQEALNVGRKVSLPQASMSQMIQKGVVVRLEGGQIMVDDQTVALGRLAGHLNKIAPTDKELGLVIVADRSLDYAELSPVILAGSSAGFTKYKFAVIKKD